LERNRGVSVVIPTRNRCLLLETAITSVLASPLVSTPRHVIVVDDDSDDDTEQVALRFGVTYLRVSFHDVAEVRNAGVALTTTPYVAFLDDDDVWLPGNMQPQLAALVAYPAAAFAFGVAQCADEELQPLPHFFPAPPPAGNIDADALHRAYPCLGTVLFRRDAVEAVNGFDKGVRYYADGELMLRMASRYKIIGVDAVGVLYRIRPPSRERADYHWVNRHVVRWRPKYAGVGWRSRAVFQYRHRSLHFNRFLEDAAACALADHRLDASICTARAVWIDPWHAVRHPRWVAGSLGRA
jgi:glycosyltransferase involved in cell wall biosynthesis